MKMELIDVVRKLTGPINPVGESNCDDARYENLKMLCDLVNSLVTDIDSVAYKNMDKVEYSMKRAGDYAKTFLSKTLGIVG